ncbi:MAG: pyruvate dehydrogenase (acetyl-transferring), homodimeric type, partial [Candidatus Eremiobacteraeota bacterium]|nr:pyruvate dehydrogenase (acetyl-transferring), homodimeric type [Candidatus Eremiobacteraeota bacterium]
SYSTSDEPMIPLFIFYSMFGFQRIGDLTWAAGDMRSRGFLIGGTSGRTTLNGEGLQHEDGHSQLAASFIPNCVSYDPTFGYELAVIVRDGLRRMLGEQQDVYYYITVLNENYRHPAMPEGAEEGIIKGLYLLHDSTVRGDGAAQTGKELRVQLLGSGAILREVIAAAELLRGEYGVAADVWSATSFNELRRDGLDVDRWNLLHPEADPRIPYVTAQLEARPGPIVAASDYLKSYADGIRPFVKRRFHALGTDGYGRSDYRRKLRSFFEVDRRWIALAALGALAADGAIERATVTKARDAFGIDPQKPNPVTV